MKPIKAKDLENALLKKGFQKQEGSNHAQYFFYYQNKKTSIRVSVSRGSKSTYGGYLINCVRKQMNLDDNQQLESFVDCTFSEQSYCNHLLATKKIMPLIPNPKVPIVNEIVLPVATKQPDSVA